MSRIPRRRLLLAGLGLVLTAGAALGAYSVLTRREVTTSSAEALRFYRLGRENQLKLYNKEALTAYAEALKLDPHFVMATVRLAAMTRDRDPERARALFDGIRPYVGSVSERERIQIRYFEAGLERKTPKEQEQVLDEWIRRFPDDPEPYFLQAEHYVKTDRMPQAIGDLEKVISLNPNFAYAYNTLGYYFLGQGDYAKAEEYLRRYRFLAPDQANPNDSLGELYLSIGRYEEAEEFLKKALEVKPDFYPSVAHLGTLEVARGNFLAAADRFREAAERADAPGDRSEQYFCAATALAVAGRADEAVALLGKVAPPPAEGDEKLQKARQRMGYQRRAVILSLLGRSHEAAEELEAFSRLLGDLPDEAKASWEREAGIARGFIAAHEGRHEEAAAAFRAAIPKGPAPGGFGYFPGMDMLRVALARSLAAAGRPEEAEEALKPVLSRNPKFQPAVDVAARIKGGAAARS
ncbi:MAG TPA: tetratricopeptide repeat protein [Thermoanaerobaculia bacterium]|nr:tetratricopeptide repeat protein [Thermoanaerobaculia bacterium]HQR67410.1 tetratricopeptide repeat protein [Thermoanaerobaculia bacterium]